MLVSLSFLYSNAQKYVVTPNGLRNSLDQQKTYLVLELDGVDANTAYQRAIDYVNENYKNPEEVIVGQKEGQFLKFKTFEPDFIEYDNSGADIPIIATYNTSLKFKDNKIRYEITSLEMENKPAAYHYNVLFQGGIFSGYIIYKKNGKLYKESAKIDIENYFNRNLDRLLSYLKGTNEDDDW